MEVLAFPHRENKLYTCMTVSTDFLKNKNVPIVDYETPLNGSINKLRVWVGTNADNIVSYIFIKESETFFRIYGHDTNGKQVFTDSIDFAQPRFGLYD